MTLQFHNRKLNDKILYLCMIFNIIMSSLPQPKSNMPDIDKLHPVPASVVAASTEWNAKNNTKVVSMKKSKNNKRSKSKIQDDLNRLRKSRQFRDLGDQFDYFSD